MASLIRQTDMITEAHAPWLTVGRRIGIAGLASLTGGVLVLGFGGRLAMRLSGAMAILIDPSTRLELTGDGFRIGVITIDGSLGFVLFGGVFGAVIAAAYWALIEPHLTRRRPFLLAGAAAAAIGGNQFVRTDNVDFVILRPIAMNVLLYPVLSAMAGISIVAIHRRLEQRAFTTTVAGSAVLTAFGMVGALILLALLATAGGDEPWLAIELLALAGVTVPIWVAETRRRDAPGWAVQAAPMAAAAVIAVEWVRLLATAWDTLA